MRCSAKRVTHAVSGFLAAVDAGIGDEPHGAVQVSGFDAFHGGQVAVKFQARADVRLLEGGIVQQDVRAFRNSRFPGLSVVALGAYASAGQLPAHGNTEHVVKSTLS